MRQLLVSVMLCGVILVGAQAQAQQPTPPAQVPEKMPFDIPYGTTITLERAKPLIAAAQAEAKKHDWKLAIAVVDPAGDLVAFEKMDGTQLAPVRISQSRGIHGDVAVYVALRDLSGLRSRANAACSESQSSVSRKA